MGVSQGASRYNLENQLPANFCRISVKLQAGSGLKLVLPVLSHIVDLHWIPCHLMRPSAQAVSPCTRYHRFMRIKTINRPRRLPFSVLPCE